jgi:hypothetical protein
MVTKTIMAGANDQERRQPEQGGIHARRQNQLLGHQLDRIRDRLQQPAYPTSLGPVRR